MSLSGPRWVTRVAALIEQERTKRDLSLAEDNIRLTVRDSYRRLEREIVSVKIQKDSLALAVRTRTGSLAFERS